MLFGAAGAVGAAAFLAACGGDDDDDGGDTDATDDRRHDRRHDGRHGRRAAGGGDIGADARPRMLGIEEASAGKGKTIELGAVLALTGTGSFYGKTMSRGLDLAAKHIAAAGGPTFNVHLHRPQVGRRRSRRCRR